MHLRWLLGGVLALLAVSTVLYLEAPVWPLGLIASAAIGLAMAFPAAPGKVPRVVWRLGMPAIAGFFVLDLCLHEMIPAFIRLTVLLVLYRAVAHRTRREDLQLVVLCLFLVVVTGVLTVSVVFAVQIVGFTAVALSYLFVVNLVRDARGEADDLPPPLWAIISRKRMLLRLWGNVDLRTVSLAAGLLGAVVALAAVIFLALPRLQMDGSLGFLQLKRARSMSGFSENIALGDVTDISQDHTIAMRVDVDRGAENPAVPYWRMVVLDEYGGGSFRVSRAVLARVGARSLESRAFAPDWWEGTAPTAPDEATAHTFSCTVYLEGGVSRYLPLPGRFDRVLFRDVESHVPNPVFHLLSTPGVSAGLLSYRIEGGDFGGWIPDPHFGREILRSPAAPGGDEAAGDDPFRYRHLHYPATTFAVPLAPEDRAYLREVVAGLTGGEKLDARTFARRACGLLAARHDYAMKVSLAEAGSSADPVIRWMQSGSPGHCEFFASALTLLARAAGFPARAVTGFKGGTWNAYEHYFMVRNSDAHAWCEVHDGQGGWFRVDPTPGAEGVAGPREAAPTLAEVASDRSVNAYFDSLRMIWYRRIVSFDQRSQREVVGSLKTFGGFAAEGASWMLARARDEMMALAGRVRSMEHRVGLLLAGVSLGGLVFLLRRSGARVSDLWGWMARGERGTRRRAGRLLRRLQYRLAEPRPGRNWNPGTARELESQLELIRFGRAERWPEPWGVFRAVRRLL